MLRLEDDRVQTERRPSLSPKVGRGQVVDSVGLDRELDGLWVGHRRVWIGKRSRLSRDTGDY